MSTCVDCRHWLAGPTVQHSQDRFGHCRRFPPMRQPMPSGWQEDAIIHNLSPLQIASVVSVWPVTRTDEACGEHSPKEEYAFKRTAPE